MNRVKYEHANLGDTEAGLLWEDICDESRIDRFHKKIVPHDKSVLFGYADVTLVIKTASGVKCPVKLRGLVVKSLKGNPHIDMPAEKGGDGEFYDHFMPRSAALRTVLTTFVFADEEVQAVIAEAASAPIEGTSTGTSESAESGTPGEEPSLRAGNPFAPAA